MIFLGSVLLIYMLWVYYLAVMCLKQANDKTPLSGFTKIMAWTVLYPGLLLDFLANVFVMSVLFVELPKEWVVTVRLSRHIKDENGWRKSLAKWFCFNLLDRFDPSGCHCK